MITTEGKVAIRKYWGGQGPLPSAVVLGIGSTAENTADTALVFETARVPVDLVSFDFINNLLVFKATLPSEFSGLIHEAGLVAIPTNQQVTNFGSTMLTSFDSETEAWVTGSNPATYSSSTTRIGVDSLSHSPTTSSSQTSTLSDVFLDLSGFSNADRFSVAFNVANANTAAVFVRFLTDSSNYYSLNLGAQSAGYKITSVPKGNAVVTGSPNWSNINEIQVSTTASSVGPSIVSFDGVRIEDVDSNVPAYTLVTRKVLETPLLKEPGRTHDLEYSLGISV